MDQPGGENPDDVPDWLRSLRSDDVDQPGESTSGPAAPGEGADWLSRIRSRAQDELGGTQGKGQEEDTPDWLNSLSGADQEASSGDMEEWMSTLTANTGEEDLRLPADSSIGDQITSEPGENLDWLGGLREPEQPSPEKNLPAEEPAEAGGFGLTGFLASMEENPEEGGGLPLAEEPAAPEPPLSFSGDPLEGLPEWLGGEPPSAGEQPHDTGESGSGLPEWLQSLSEEPAPSSSAGEEVFPGWLEGGTDEPAGEPAGHAEEPPVELPEWLGGEPGPAQEAEQQPQESGIPDWLASFAVDDEQQGEKAGEVPQWSEESPAEAGADLPEWMKEQEFSRKPPEFSAETALPEQDYSALQELAGQEEPSGVENLPVQEFESVQEEPAEPETSQEGLPDWLAGFAAEEPVEKAAAGSETSASAPLFVEDEQGKIPEGGEVPDWLRNFDAQPAEGESIPPLLEPEAPLESEPVFEGETPFAVDLPDWLSEDSSQPAGELVEPAAEPAGEELAQAELPDWVKEMRPIESIIPGAALMAETERKPEKSGPLAGMNGVLPAEEVASRYSKPPVYTVKLQVTEKQRNQAAQFDTILAQETQPLLIPPQGKSVQGLLMRIVVALLLIVTLSLPPLMGMEPLAMPALYPAETQRMYEQIESSLPADSPVLLAVDFEPGMYGEMRLASIPVLEHLISKNARIVIISTRPNGPALAQNLLSAAAEGYEQYDMAASTENLGYLPGDTISLLAFAARPSFAAPANLGGELAWKQPILQPITSIRDFSRVIVLTDTAETGRAWVEQVQPQMGNVPLLMVTSAQAAPMMAPFVQSDQVNGMVSGQFGGVLYARWARQDSPVGEYLASYQVGIILAFVLTLLGGLISGVLALAKRGQKEGE